MIIYKSDKNKKALNSSKNYSGHIYIINTTNHKNGRQYNSIDK